MAGAAVSLIAGILLYEIAVPVAFIIFVIAFFLIVFLQVKNKILHPMYFIFPIIMITGFILRGRCEIKSDFLVRLESCGKTECELTGDVERVINSDSGYKIYLRNVNVYCDGGNIKTENCLVYSDKKYIKGDALWASGQAVCFKTASNPGEFDLRQYYRTVGMFYGVYAKQTKLLEASGNPVYRLADALSAKLEKTLYAIAGEREASAFAAMLLGNKEDLDNRISDLFAICGIGHILAISGLHISLIGMGLYKILRKCGAGYAAAMAVGSCFIIFYGIMTGGGVSQTRALIMFIAAVYANVAARTYDMLSAASLAALLMLAETPMLIHSSGFLLSFGAIAGIVIVGNTINKVFNVRNKFLNSLVTGISIQLTTLPFVMYYYYQIPVLSVFLNLIVVPLMTIVMISGIAGACTGCLNVSAGAFAIGPGVLIIRLYEKLCEFNIRLDWAVYTCGKPKIWHITVYFIILALILKLMSGRNSKKAAAALVPALSFLMMRYESGFEITFINVGQGDGIFIRMDDGTNVLIDGGSTDNSGLYEYTLEPFLLSKSADVIDFAIVTHCDDDHISGLKELLENGTIHVRNVCMPSTTLADEAYMSLWNTALECADNVKLIYDGTCLTGGDTSIICIHPDYNYACDEPNDYSTVLVVSDNDFSALLTGDINAEQEKELTETVGNFAPFNVFKAAHHGSGYSNSLEFVMAAAPEAVVVSCGKNNIYGHPHQEAVDNFLQAGAVIYRTDEDGAVVFKG